MQSWPSIHGYRSIPPLYRGYNPYYVVQARFVIVIELTICQVRLGLMAHIKSAPYGQHSSGSIRFSSVSFLSFGRNTRHGPKRCRWRLFAHNWIVAGDPLLRPSPQDLNRFPFRARVQCPASWVHNLHLPSVALKNPHCLAKFGDSEYRV